MRNPGLSNGRLCDWVRMGYRRDSCWCAGAASPARSVNVLLVDLVRERLQDGEDMMRPWNAALRSVYTLSRVSALAMWRAELASRKVSRGRSLGQLEVRVFETQPLSVR